PALTGAQGQGSSAQTGQRRPRLRFALHGWQRLKLYGMAAACEELLGERPRKAKDPVVWLEKLIEAERVDRQVRSLNYQLRIARFPIRRELDSFEWAESSVDQATFETLAEGHFTSQAHNLILVGGTGTGKTHLATALGIAVIHRGQRVRFWFASSMSWIW
ncbi:ATP-binding protein, partial [Thiolapillus sp.]|uniref:ATP-binding protein n=2 Tax=Thiolapillus sp. TaxID=2017437 RepID=UPI003AF5BCE5